MKTSLALVSTVVAILLSVCTTAHGKDYVVYTCTDSELRALGPTLDDASQPSGWGLAWTGLLLVDVDDRCPSGDRFAFRVRGGDRMAAGQTIAARWTAAPGTQLVGVSSTWQALVGFSAKTAPAPLN